MKEVAMAGKSTGWLLTGCLLLPYTLYKSKTTPRPLLREAIYMYVRGWLASRKLGRGVASLYMCKHVAGWLLARGDGASSF